MRELTGLKSDTRELALESSLKTVEQVKSGAAVIASLTDQLNTIQQNLAVIEAHIMENKDTITYAELRKLVDPSVIMELADRSSRLYELVNRVDKQTTGACSKIANTSKPVKQDK